MCAWDETAGTIEGMGNKKRPGHKYHMVKDGLSEIMIRCNQCRKFEGNLAEASAEGVHAAGV